METKSFLNRTVIVTGATGLIGEHLCRRLLREGARVIALSRSEDKIRKCYQDLFNSANFRYLAQDVSKPLELNERIDYIFHAAGPIASNIIVNKPLEVIKPNIFGTDILLTFLKNQKEHTGYNGKIILCSSGTVYSNHSAKDILLKEEDTYLTDGLKAYNAPYAQSKRMMEVIADSYFTQFGVDSVIARPSYVYGPATFLPDTALNEFLWKAAHGENIVIRNPCMEKRDWIYVDDAVDGIILIALQSTAERVFNISSAGEGNNFIAADEIAEIAAMIFHNENPKCERNPKVSYKENKNKSRKSGIILDNSKIKKLGFQVKNSINYGVTKTMVSLKTMSEDTTVFKEK